MLACHYVSVKYVTRYGVIGVSEFVKVRTTSVIILKREKRDRSH